MKTKFLFLLLAVVVLLILIYLRGGPERIHVNEIAPGFNLPKKGGAIALESYRGKAILINFWATWCPPCVSEMPSLVALHKAMEKKPFEILAISEDEEGWRAVDDFTRRLPLPFPVLLDPGGGVATEYGVYSLPESFLIDKNGIVVKHYRGPRDWLDGKITKEIQGYLDGN